MGTRGRLFSALRYSSSILDSNQIYFKDLFVFRKKSYREKIKFLEKYDCEYIFVAYGKTDPSLEISELFEANVTVPIELFEICSLLGLRLVIFGSSLETQEIQNRYFDSKRELTRFLESEGFAGVTVFHLHSMYGFVTNPSWSLLGQIERSILFGKTLDLTEGKQTREFLHWEDFFLQAWSHLKLDGIVTLCSGLEVTIEELILAFHEEYKESFRYRLGIKDYHPEEIMKLDYALMTNVSILGAKFRHPITGIIKDFQDRLVI